MSVVLIESSLKSMKILINEEKINWVKNL